MKTFEQKLQASKNIRDGLSYYKHGDAMVDTVHAIIKERNEFSKELPSKTEEEIVAETVKRLNLRITSNHPEEAFRDEYLVTKEEVEGYMGACLKTLLDADLIRLADEDGVKKYGPVYAQHKQATQVPPTNFFAMASETSRLAALRLAVLNVLLSFDGIPATHWQITVRTADVLNEQLTKVLPDGYDASAYLHTKESIFQVLDTCLEHLLAANLIKVSEIYGEKHYASVN